MLDGTSSDSLALRPLVNYARGPLRRAIRHFYAQASAHSYRLLSVKANSKFDRLVNGPSAGFGTPTDSFGGVVRQLKERYGLKYVLCWHAMMGYWSGCMPEAPEMAKYKPQLMYCRPSPGVTEVDPSMLWVHPALNGLGIAEDPVPLHNDLHTYLAESGVDGVKIDVQATITMFGHGKGGGAAMGARWHRSVEDSVASHLPGNHQINSMCCAIEDIYNMKHSNIARVGEDFYPSLPASHTAHIANAAFCTLMMGAIAWPDWDMFHSDHGSAHLHAYARAVSGGPIYVSDCVGRHDFALLRRLVLPDGTVLRCRQPGRPTRDCLFRDVSRDGQTVLKIWNMNSVTGVVGLFNVQGSTWNVRRRAYWTHDKHPPALEAVVTPADVPGLPPAACYALWSDQLKELRILDASGPAASWHLTIPGGGGHELLTLSPVLESRNEEVAVAPVGLVNMVNAGGAVLAAELAETGLSNGYVAMLRLRLRGAGRFLLYASRRPAKVLLDGERVESVEWDAAQHTAAFEVPWKADESGSGVVHDVEVTF